MQPTLLNVGLTLREEYNERERSWLGLYQHVPKFANGVLLALPSWQEVPNVLNDRLVEETLDQCVSHGLDVYFGRDLWIRWKGRTTWKQKINDVFDPAYYAAYLSRLAAEAKAIGAKGTFAECEPYGNTIFKPWFKKDGFSEQEFWRVLAAITEARQVAPATTMAYPAGAQHPNHYSWPLRYLGNQFLHHKTYQLLEFKVNATPPNGFPLQMNWWGTWIAERVYPGEKPLTVAEYQALDWGAIRQAHPDMIGNWIYIAAEEWLQVVQQLGEATSRLLHG
ncbi:MAG: hypothetical protein ACYTAO_21150 [Planctomycetota bacterium]|jgi:hypothetical protein